MAVGANAPPRPTHRSCGSLALADSRRKVKDALYYSVFKEQAEAKTIATEGFDSRRCRIAVVLGRKGRKKSSQVKFPFFRCFYWRFSDFVLNFVDREGQKNIGVCVSAQRQSLLFQHLYLSYVLFHVLTLSPKDGRAAALYGKDPYGMSSESTALYIGITSYSRWFSIK